MELIAIYKNEIVYSMEIVEGKEMTFDGFRIVLGVFFHGIQKKYKNIKEEDIILKFKN